MGATLHIMTCEVLVWKDLGWWVGGSLGKEREGEGTRGGAFCEGYGGVLAGGTGGGALWSGSVPGTTTLSWK